MQILSSETIWLPSTPRRTAYGGGKLAVSGMRDTEDQIQRAIEIGKKNQRVIELIRNWCANVSVKLGGGTGLVEQQTGLPIGPRFLECPHAPAGGMAGMDLTSIAIDYYDRNCVDCKFRKPVGLPNLKSLVDKRDAQRARQQQAQRQAEQEVADRLAAREAVRRDIRPRLDPLAATTFDQISELDRTRSKDAGARLVQIAELAPETFTPEIIDHLFTLIDSEEYWLIEPCLAAFTRLPVDKTRLCNTALAVLHSYSAREVVAKIIEEDCQYADEAPIVAALPELIRLAIPAPSRFGFGPERVVSFPGPLREAYRLHAAAIKIGFKEFLERKDAESVRTAARGLAFLGKQDASLSGFLVPELAAKLARAKWLIKGSQEEEVEETIQDVRHALTRAFEDKPQETDAVIAEYLNGATSEGVNELYHVYRDVLWKVRRHDEELILTDAHRIAFRRLVTAATESQIEEVADTAREVFRGAPYELTPLAGEEIDLLLGSAAIAAQKLRDFDANTANEPGDFLSQLQRRSQRDALANLEMSFVQWACTAAGRYGVASVEKVLGILKNLPADSDSLRAAIIRHFDKMMVSADHLALCLPHYYSALVGSSQVVRAGAADALGGMEPRILDDLPDLVFEAFTALLTDAYVIVHYAAVKALERFELPDAFRQAARNALWSLIVHYAPRSVQDGFNARFLMEMMDLYIHRYATAADRAGRLGDQFIAVMSTLRPSDVAGELRHVGRSYYQNPKYAALLFKLMTDKQVMSTYHDSLIDQIDGLSPKSLYNERAAAVALSKTMGKHFPRMLAVLIENLTAARAWKEAAEITSAAYDGVENTTRMKPIRLHMGLRKIACDFEAAIAAGNVEALGKLATEWKATATELQNDEETHRARRDPLFGIRGTH